ncbi:folylpolyglutamate synthase/dihydrofolate synthase family protein [Microvirga sp. W0021]|uniref:Folylpolyglutamate synthase/dihydrofolate synthase family protein n=1 Tax=Hohaiivirga grylli TaxID=3133970 RepID=A0ABV0BFR1_9HYPH
MDSSDAIIARFLALHPKAVDLSLDRIQRLLEDLGNPHKRLPPTIHVAGTNGKGSTIATMRAILEAAGVSTHVYTSPHLVRFHERIRLGSPTGGRCVSEDRLLEALRRCEAVNAGRQITVFEMTTATALLLFAEEPADVLLLEVGLGGRFDATNVIDEPIASVVTPIGLDHAEFLGTDIVKIANEKAGIFKKGCPAIIAPQFNAEADKELYRTAVEVGAFPILVGNQDFSVHEERGRLVYQDETGLLDLPRPKLAGRHQFINAGTAIAALRATKFGSFEQAAFEKGLEQTEWPGRLQKLKHGNLVNLAPQGSELWLDGGHNIDGARVLSQAMADLEERHAAPLVLICGMLGTKDSQGFLKQFVGLSRDLVAVSMHNQIAARSADEIRDMAKDLGFAASSAASIEAAITSLNKYAWEKPPRILICGSLYLAGEVLAANGTPPV